MLHKLQAHLSWPNETQCNTGVHAATNQVSLSLDTYQIICLLPVHCHWAWLSFWSLKRVQVLHLVFYCGLQTLVLPSETEHTVQQSDSHAYCWLSRRFLLLFKCTFKKNLTLGYVSVLWAYIDMKGKTWWAAKELQYELSLFTR